MSGPQRIDFHNHFIPDVYRQTLAEAGVHEIGRVPFPKWDLMQLDEAMKTLGIERALLSISAPGVDFGDNRLGVTLAQRTNDLLIEQKADNPRLGGLATLPLPSVDDALAELDRLTGSGLEGLIILSNYRGKYLADPMFDPLFEELDRRQALVLLHPNLPAAVDTMGLSLPPPILEFTFDTTRCVADMIFTGWLDRFPNIRWVISHLGGALPFVAWRMSMIEHSPRGAFAAFRERGRSVKSYLQSLHYDTAVSAGPPSLRALIDLVGIDKVVFGSDVPFLPFNFARLTTAALDESDVLSVADHRKIDRENGARLLGDVLL